jgi:hypothetical protein
MTITMAQIAADQQERQQANVMVHVARYMLLGRGDMHSAIKEAQQRHALPVIQAYLKAAVVAGSTLAGNWAQPLRDFESSISAFVASLKNFGCFDQSLPFMKNVPIRTRCVVVTTGVVGATVPEGSAKAISNIQLSGSNIEETKCSCIVVAADELLRAGGAIATNLIGDELRRALAVTTDTVYISKISSGIATIPSGGNTADKIWGDLEAALDAISITADSKIFVFTTPAIARSIVTKTSSIGTQAFPNASLQSGPLGPAQMVISDGVPSGQMIVCDVSQFAGSGGVVIFDSSNQASLQMESAPDSPPLSTSVATSLWQSGLAALKAERIFGVERMRAASVAIVSGISY